MLMAICTDASRCGSCVYVNSSVQLVADRKDAGDPYKGLDIMIQKIDPEVVIVSAVQTRLINFLEKRFRVQINDISKVTNRRFGRSQKPKGPTQTEISTEQIALQLREQSAIAAQGIPSVLQVIEPNEEPPSNLSDYMFTLAIVPNSWFCMSAGIQKLIDSELVRNQGFEDHEQKSLFITSKVERSLDVCAIRSISALHKYIEHSFILEPDADVTMMVTGTQHTNPQQVSQNTQVTGDQHERLNLMPILEIKYIDPGPVLSIDKFTFESLNIFPHHSRKPSLEEELGEHNPDKIKIPSLYEVLSQCLSPQGKRQLRTIMMWPLQSIEEITHRQNAIEFLMEPGNKLLRDQIAGNIKNIIPLSTLLTRLSHSVGTYRDLTSIYKALWSFFVVIDLIKSSEIRGVEIFNRIANLDLDGLRSLVESIMNVVDFEASRRERRIQICVGVDQDVDEKKEIVNNLASFCDQIGIQETVKYKDVLGKTCRVLYLPRIGFLNSVDYSTNSEFLQIKSNKEFDILLNTEQSVYFKTKRMEELDNNAGDIACDLIDVQERVILNLQNELLKHTEVVLTMGELFGELDCLISFAIVAFQRGYTRPEFTSSNEEIDIRKAYHPLQCIQQNIVPNDIRFYKEGAERQVRVMVITGPNSCGKTTYMKAACLVVYMAHIGCFVPASCAKLPIVDAILTRMHSANSISTGLSSFATDIHQINYALARATDKSLIVIDEFGKGTQARDGFALLKALVTYFVVRTQKSPYVMISTHFNRLVDHLQSFSEYILYKTFKVTRNPGNGNIVYEFKSIGGVGEISLADKVAASAGVPQRIIDRANQIRDYITEGRLIRPRPPCGA